MRVSLQINSSIDEIPLVYGWLDGIIRPLTGKERCETILLVTQEIVTNAIIHGNREDPEKQVALDLQVTDTEFIIHIQDEGIGIDMLPSEEEADSMDLPEFGGRGLKLAVMLSDVVRVEGNRVELRFWRGGK